MKENSLYDKKSIRAVTGKTAKFDEIIKDCVAFSNAEGGNLDIGIEDAEKMPPENQKIGEDLMTAVVKKIRENTNGVTVSAKVLSAKNGGEYMRLNIPRNANAVSMTSSGTIYIRLGDQSRPAEPEDIARLAEDRGCVSWEDSETRYHWKDADQEKLNGTVKLLKESERVSDFVKQKDVKELLDYYFLTDPETGNMTNLGVLFIGKQTQRGRLPNSPIVQCIKYDGGGEKVNKWLWDDYSRNPYEIINEIWRNVPEWKESTEINDGMFRRDIPAYPEKVIRELLVNSLVHRPYTIRGDVFINIHPDRIEIVNPGRLPLGVTPENILHVSKKRNEHMAALFYALRLMEREGSGYDMMYETLLTNGKNIPTVIEGQDSVTVRVERIVANPEMIKVMQYAGQNASLNQKQLICLGIIALRESITASHLISALQIKDSDSLRSWLRPLLDKEIVVGTSERSKSKEYRVNPKVLKDSHYKGRTTLKRIERYRLKELIIEDLKIYKRASLKDIRQRIGTEISERKIREQLSRLETENKVRKTGQNRWVKYEIIE